MKMIDVLVVRVYVTEASHLLEKIIYHLKTEATIRGISVFRAISGYGESGTHESSLLDLSLNLPLTIEFFDNDKLKIEKSIEYLSSIIKPEHIIVWEAKANG